MFSNRISAEGTVANLQGVGYSQSNISITMLDLTRVRKIALKPVAWPRWAREESARSMQRQERNAFKSLL